MKKYNYITSKDYHQLYQHLMQYPEEAIVCFLKEKYSVQLCYVKKRGVCVEVGYPGTSLVNSANIEEFVQNCEEYQIEYIKPLSLETS